MEGERTCPLHGRCVSVKHSCNSAMMHLLRQPYAEQRKQLNTGQFVRIDARHGFGNRGFHCFILQRMGMGIFARPDLDDPQRIPVIEIFENNVKETAFQLRHALRSSSHDGSQNISFPILSGKLPTESIFLHQPNVALRSACRQEYTAIDPGRYCQSNC